MRSDQAVWCRGCFAPYLLALVAAVSLSLSRPKQSAVLPRRTLCEQMRRAWLWLCCWPCKLQEILVAEHMYPGTSAYTILSSDGHKSNDGTDKNVATPSALSPHVWHSKQPLQTV